MLIRTCSPFWFDFLSTEYPQRLPPHCSMRTLPSFSSVSHTPSGEFEIWAGAGAAGLGAIGGGAASGGAGGIAAMAGAGAGGAAGAVSCWTDGGLGGGDEGSVGVTAAVA